MSIQDVTARLPRDGQMGALYRKRRSLYYLIITVAGAAFLGVCLAILYGLLLFPLIAAQAVVAAASGDPVFTGAWFVLMVAVGLFFVAVVVLVGRWVGEFTMEAE